jgi:hypothetical protein
LSFWWPTSKGNRPWFYQYFSAVTLIKWYKIKYIPKALPWCSVPNSYQNALYETRDTVRSSIQVHWHSIWRIIDGQNSENKSWC